MHRLKQWQQRKTRYRTDRKDSAIMHLNRSWPTLINVIFLTWAVKLQYESKQLFNPRQKKDSVRLVTLTDAKHLRFLLYVRIHATIDDKLVRWTLSINRLCRAESATTSPKQCRTRLFGSKCSYWKSKTQYTLICLPQVQVAEQRHS